MVSKIRSFRDLVLWQKGLALAQTAYRLARGFPHPDRPLADQMCRAAISIPANIAEGFGRKTTRDFCHFLTITNGSLKELESHIELAASLGLLRKEALEKLLPLVDDVGRLLVALRQSLNRRL